MSCTMAGPALRILSVVVISAWMCAAIDVQQLKEQRKQQVKAMFYHAYEGYLQHAFPHDELRAQSCTGVDTWGPLMLTLVDTLDTLYVLGNVTEFQRACDVVAASLNFDMDRNVSVFETNIRIVGGLLSAHQLAMRLVNKREVESSAAVRENASEHSQQSASGWSYKGQLLTMARDLVDRLLPAFDTPTGIPYGTVNLRYGVPPGETTVTSLAGAGTHLLEFSLLSMLTGNNTYANVARTAMLSLYGRRSKLGLYGNHMDVWTGLWTLRDAGIGPNQDSFYEYMLKGYLLTGDDTYLDMFESAYRSINQYMKQGDWYVDVNMDSGSTTLPWFTALGCFFPGLQAMYGDVVAASRTLTAFLSIWRRFGFVPEVYDLSKKQVHERLTGYFLRPELAESVMYLYQATRDPKWLIAGESILDSIETVTKTRCGYTVVENVTDHRLGDRMESFFLSETLKYLYLLYDDDNLLHADHVVFNTEAHPFFFADGDIYDRESVSVQNTDDDTSSHTDTSEADVQATYVSLDPTPARHYCTVPPPRFASAVLDATMFDPEPVQEVALPPEPHHVPSPPEQADGVEAAINLQESLASQFSLQDIGKKLKETIAQLPLDLKGSNNPAQEMGSPDLAALPTQGKLATIRQSTFRATLGYWTYEVKFGRNIVQKHLEDVNSPATQEYLLGTRHIASRVAQSTSLSRAQTIVDGTVVDPVPSAHAVAFAARDAQPSANADQQSEVAITEEEEPVFVHFYTGGTECEGGLQRVARARFFCNSATDVSQAVVVKVEEFQTCIYDVAVLAPLFCL